MEDGDQLLSLSEAAQIAGMTRQHLALLARAGKLQAQRVGSRWVTTRRAVAEYLGDEEKRSKNPHKNNS